MEKSYEIINRLLVETFNDILTIEEKSLKEGAFNNVSITEVHTVEAIGLHTKKTMSEVARELNITVGTLTVAINNLVKKGFVERERSESDKRVVYVKLSKQGRVLFRIHEKFHSDLVEASISGLNEEEENVLVSALFKLDYFLKEKYNIDKGAK